MASVSYRNDREEPSKLLWSQDEVITVKARQQNTSVCHQVLLPVPGTLLNYLDSRDSSSSQLITFKQTYWSSASVCLTPSSDRGIKVSILNIRLNNLASFTPTPLVPVIFRGCYRLFHFNINASILSLVRREWRTQLRHSFGSRGPSVWGSNSVLLLAVSLGCSYLCLFMEFLTVMSVILLPEVFLFVLLHSVCSWRPSPKQPPASPNAIYFYLGAAVSFRMLLIGPLVTTGKVT